MYEYAYLVRKLRLDSSLVVGRLDTIRKNYCTTSDATACCKLLLGILARMILPDAAAFKISETLIYPPSGSLGLQESVLSRHISKQHVRLSLPLSFEDNPAPSSSMLCESVTSVAILSRVERALCKKEKNKFMKQDIFQHLQEVTPVLTLGRLSFLTSLECLVWAKYHSRSRK